MINYIWGMMIIIGILYSGFTGKLSDVTTYTVASAKDAVQLAITMLGVVAMWTGIMKIAEKSGLIDIYTEKLRKILKFLFPAIPKNHPASKYIAVNFIANILGLGWAATPAGLKAMEELQKLNRDKKVASNEMCLFMVINMSSLQLISINLIAYRMEYNSQNPAEVIGPGIAVTIATTVLGIVLCKLAERKKAEY